MNLTNLKRELERLKEIARDRPIKCFCRYVEIQSGKPLTEEQGRILENNMECRERIHEDRAHVGFAYVEVPPAA
jgi:hypothetical protein